MRKFTTIILIAILLALVTVSTTFAKTSNIKGEVTAIGTETITVLVDAEKSILVYLPENFDTTLLQIGAYVHIKGQFQEDGSITADWVRDFDKAADADDKDEKADADAADGNKLESAYCTGENEKSHPAATILANHFDVSVEAIMVNFCAGHGLGQIAKALKTEQLTGVAADVLLASRAEGKGWGQIWKELGYQGKPKTDKIPPGQVKHPDKDKTKEKGAQD